MKAKYLLVPFLLLTSCTILWAQQPPTFKGPQVYLEFGGGASGLTINAEHVITKAGRWYVNGRLGFGYLPGEDARITGTPVSLNLFSRVGNHHFETGIGLSYIEGIWMDVRFGRTIWSEALYVFPMAGYRFQRPRGGLFFKALWTPLLELKEYSKESRFLYKTSGALSYWFGLSAGYYFVSRK